MLEKGTVTYLPRDLALKDKDQLGSIKNLYAFGDNENESDLDEDDEDSVKDPNDEFAKEVEDLF